MVNNMRLIDADYALAALMLGEAQSGGLFETDSSCMQDFLKALPTIDAVPVVRCKDCKHYELDACLKIYQDGNVSNDAWQERKPTDFCSYGERKE
jgi:hypothetical protein